MQIDWNCAACTRLHGFNVSLLSVCYTLHDTFTLREVSPCIAPCVFEHATEQLQAWWKMGMLQPSPAPNHSNLLHQSRQASLHSVRQPCLCRGTSKGTHSPAWTVCVSPSIGSDSDGISHISIDFASCLFFKSRRIWMANPYKYGVVFVAPVCFKMSLGVNLQASSWMDDRRPDQIMNSFVGKAALRSQHPNQPYDRHNDNICELQQNLPQCHFGFIIWIYISF